MQFASASEHSAGHHPTGQQWFTRVVGDDQPGARCRIAHAQLKTADGRDVATATFDFTNGYVTVSVKTVAAGILAPGFHPMHVHEIGKCEPNSVAPTGGPPGNFLSAGGQYQAPGHTGKPGSGDLTSLEVRSDAPLTW